MGEPVAAEHYLNLLEQACSLESLARGAGLRPRGLEPQYTEEWLAGKRTQLMLGMDFI